MSLIISARFPLLNIQNCIHNASVRLLFSRTDILIPQTVEQQQRRNVGGVKRRHTHPMRWWAKRKQKVRDDVTQDNKGFLDRLIEHQKMSLPTVAEMPDDVPQWTPESKRCGLIAKKIGVHPMWQKDGKRILTTILHVNDLHVVKAFTSEEYKKKTIVQNRWKSDGYACLVLGSGSDDPRKYTAEYQGLFREAGLLPKRKLARFYVSDDALLQPGTPLDVRHVRVGEILDIFGITRDYGFQGAMFRWNFKGQPSRNTTKAHRRPGAIGRGRKTSGPWRGKKMPGHMGSERVTQNGFEILRINYEHNLIYVRGPAVPGITNSWCLLHDSKCYGKRHTADNPPPFPTYFETDADKQQQVAEAYHESIHHFEEPTITFVETEAEKRVVRTGAKLAKVRTKS